MAVLLEYLDLFRTSISYNSRTLLTSDIAVTFLVAPFSYKWLIFLPIMPELCSKLAYYAGIMLNALACLLCLKLCRHNRHRPNLDATIVLSHFLPKGHWVLQFIGVTHAANQVCYSYCILLGIIYVYLYI